MKSRYFCFFILLGALCFGTAPSFANQYTWDSGCECWVPDTSGPDVTPPSGGGSPPPASPPPAGRCLTGPPGLNANAAGVGDVNNPKFEIHPCDLESSQACENPDGRKHLVYVSNGLKLDKNLREKLVVVLPGSGQDPAHIKYLLKSAAYAGFRTIGLTYRGLDLKDACPSVGGSLLNAMEYSDCVDRFRQETLYGGDFLDPVSSIKQRLTALLEHLDGIDPTGGWDGYLKGSGATLDLRYAKIIIAGFSLGSGHAAYWAKDEKFGGVVTLAGPTDHTDVIDMSSPAQLSTFPSLASWISGSHATPGDRRAALLHLGEGEEKLEVISMAWDAFGLSTNPPKDLTHAWDAQRIYFSSTGAPAHDYLPWPYRSSEQRFTINTATGNCNAHEATATDSCVDNDMNFGADVPRVFGVYMHLFCSI